MDGVVRALTRVTRAHQREVIAKLALEAKTADLRDAIVDALRHEEISWPQIAEAMGVSRQAVHNRFAHLISPEELM